MNNMNDSNRLFVNRTKWEKEEKSEKKSFLQRKQEEKEARLALRDFKRDLMWEELEERNTRNRHDFLDGEDND